MTASVTGKSVNEHAVTRKSVNKRRLDATFSITAAALGTASITAIPTPALELSKQLSIAATDLALCWRVYEIYFDDQLNTATALELLRTLGAVTAVGGALTYTAIKLSQVIVDELSILLGPARVGISLISATASGATTLALGAAWMLLCDRMFENRNAPQLPAQTEVIVLPPTLMANPLPTS
jgi:hypothetical protein